MTSAIVLYNKAADVADRNTSEWLLPTVARAVFASTLLLFFWNSAMTKLGDGVFGLFSPSVGAYFQIFPKQTEAVGYDPSQLTLFHTLIVIAGMAAEFMLPVLIVLGLLTRLASLAMIGFVVVMSYVDLFGHGLDAKSAGMLFDNSPYGIVFDQRLFWGALLLFLASRGAGPISLDRILGLR